MTANPDPARQRFAALTGLRLVAALLIIAGMMLVSGNIEQIDASLAMPAGIVLIGIGLTDFIVFIPFLTRRWRSPDQ